MQAFISQVAEWVRTFSSRCYGVPSLPIRVRGRLQGLPIRVAAGKGDKDMCMIVKMKNNNNNNNDNT